MLRLPGLKAETFTVHDHRRVGEQKSAWCRRGDRQDRFDVLRCGTVWQVWSVHSPEQYHVHFCKTSYSSALHFMQSTIQQ